MAPARLFSILNSKQGRRSKKDDVLKNIRSISIRPWDAFLGVAGGVVLGTWGRVRGGVCRLGGLGPRISKGLSSRGSEAPGIRMVSDVRKD